MDRKTFIATTAAMNSVIVNADGEFQVPDSEAVDLACELAAALEAKGVAPWVTEPPKATKPKRARALGIVNGTNMGWCVCIGMMCTPPFTSKESAVAFADAINGDGEK